MNSSDLRRKARNMLRDRYVQAFFACLTAAFLVSIGPVISAVSSLSAVISAIVRNGDVLLPFRLGVSSFSSVWSIISVIIGGAVETGLAYYFLSLANGRQPQLEDVFSQFRQFGNALGAYVLRLVRIFLLSLLFVVPGILAALSYSMTMFILAEHPEMDFRDALSTSKSLMRGNRGRLFRLYLSFLPWFLLCSVTGGIGYLFLRPYVIAAETEFFNEVSGNNYRRRTENENRYRYTY